MAAKGKGGKAPARGSPIAGLTSAPGLNFMAGGQAPFSAENLDELSSIFAQQWAAAAGANQQQYNEIQRDFSRLLNYIATSGKALSKGYTKAETDVLGKLEGQGADVMELINRNYEQSKAESRDRMAGMGTLESAGTIKDRGFDLDKNLAQKSAQLGINDQIGRAMQILRQAALSFRERNRDKVAQAAQGKISHKDSVDIAYPNESLYAQTANQLAQKAQAQKQMDMIRDLIFQAGAKANWVASQDASALMHRPANYIGQMELGAQLPLIGLGISALGGPGFSTGGMPGGFSMPQMQSGVKGPPTNPLDAVSLPKPQGEDSFDKGLGYSLGLGAYAGGQPSESRGSGGYNNMGWSGEMGRPTGGSFFGSGGTAPGQAGFWGSLANLFTSGG